MALFYVRVLQTTGSILRACFQQVINAQNEAGEIVSFSNEDLLLIRHFATSAAMALERAQMTRTFFLRMIRMTELRDPKETAPHVIRVGAYSTEIYEVWARARGMAEKDIERQRDVLRLAAMLHDVGKVGIVDRILKKPAPLTVDEYEIMKAHTLIGEQLFADPKSDFEEAAALVALNHHERWDGKGYPGHVDPMTGLPLDGRRDGGKKGEEIPLLGRIVAIADVYDALCSARSYKDAWQEENVLAEMRKESGKHFDPELLQHFFSILDLIQSIKARYPDPA